MTYETFSFTQCLAQGYGLILFACKLHKRAKGYAEAEGILGSRRLVFKKSILRVAQEYSGESSVVTFSGSREVTVDYLSPYPRTVHLSPFTDLLPLDQAPVRSFYLEPATCKAGRQAQGTSPSLRKV